MSITNGIKTFLYVALLKRAGEVQAYVLRSDHDPEAEEFARLFGLTLGPGDEVQAARYEYDHLPVVPPKNS